MRKTGARIKHSKERGEWAELCFMVRAGANGLKACKPWGDTARFDFVVEHNGHLSRVQVKSTINKRKTHYELHMCDCHGKAYSHNAFDFLAAYIIPEDMWFIIPAKKVRRKTGIALYPKPCDSKYDSFREAWELLYARPQGTNVGTVHACVEEGFEKGFDVPFPALDENRIAPDAAG